MAQGGHDGRHTLAALLQVGIEQLLGGVVDDGDEGDPLVGARGQPAVTAPIEVKELAEARAGLAAAAMPASRPGFGDQAGRLQGLLDEGIAGGR
jgi:hypothetical protein